MVTMAGAGYGSVARQFFRRWGDGGVGLAVGSVEVRLLAELKRKRGEEWWWRRADAGGSEGDCRR
ncbi:hypothetical protein HAX54_017219, partial [Datura stramonium]|nr:hypothetical protein [Datura stramonium]